SPMSSAPDVTVTYAEGRYHLCFDWGTRNWTWQTAADPPADVNSGVGYAWAERPEGPFHRAKRPIATTRGQTALLGKYRRLYASTLIRRADDWLVLTLTDSGRYYGWALLGMTADAPDGPYSEPQLLLHPESDRYHPPLLEFFPAFVHESFLYAPATSVALNRNFQALFRVPVEKAMEPEAWALAQPGSLWHAEPVEHEAYGIWGQTFTGFVGRDGLFNVMFASRDSAGLGTINLASRPWNRPYTKQGFVVSGHEGPSLACLKRSGPPTRIELELEAHGTVALLWNMTGPLGPDRPASNSTLHPLSFTRHNTLEFAGPEWTLAEFDDDGNRHPVATGQFERTDTIACSLEWNRKGMAVLELGGTEAWTGPLATGPGLFGLLVQPHSHARVTRFALGGIRPSFQLPLLHTEALLGAAQNMADWEDVADERFRYGIGAVSRTASAWAKWNFEGDEIELWGPGDPAYGKAAVFLDGEEAGIVDFHSAGPEESSPVFRLTGFEDGRHTIAVRVVEGRMPLDVLVARSAGPSGD
ncbi:MAG: hypothetical protein JXR94_05290, partial [Candidatus Hydrogenedentes bacterium]|nr:hypothetical protein [Candidatus Hydrogenedentota bacterium]